ncbi:MAG: IS3 family transposase, partial [Dolichospermum sp.]
MLLKEIKNVHNNSKKTYGSPRITKELQSKNIPVSEVLVAKIMKENDIRSVVKKKYKVTTDTSHKYPV